MTVHFATYCLLPLAFGTVGVLLMAWLYLLSDYGTWWLFVRHKTRVQLVWTMAVAWLGCIVLDAIAYKIGQSTAAPDKTVLPAGVGIVFLCVIGAVIAAPVYRLSDGLVRRLCKAEKRSSGGGQGIGIYAQRHAGLGGEYYI